MIVLVYIFFVLCIFCLARSRGRSGIIWAIIALIISPLFAGILLLVMQNLRKQQTSNQVVQVVVNNVVNPAEQVATK